ncbi:unnamed protein product, partial [Musa acuminata var. zebrina]
RPISLFSHAQKRIHIVNNSVPLLDNDARSPSLLPLHDCLSTPCIKIAIAICTEPCEAASHSPTAILHNLIQPLPSRLNSLLHYHMMIQGSARNRPISLLSHAQRRIHIGNHGIPLLHDDARSPCLLPHHDYSVYQYVIVLVL